MDDRPLTAALRRRTILAATAGNALEFYDFITFAFFAIQIAADELDADWPTRVRVEHPPLDGIARSGAGWGGDTETNQEDLQSAVS